MNGPGFHVVQAKIPSALSDFNPTSDKIPDHGFVPNTLSAASKAYPAASKACGMNLILVL